MERVSGDLLRAPGFPKGPAGPLAVPRASELAAGFSVPFCPVKKERSRKPEADPCGPQYIQNKESNPGNIPAGRGFAGKAKPRGGVETPPYRTSRTVSMFPSTVNRTVCPANSSAYTRPGSCW